VSSVFDFREVVAVKRDGGEVEDEALRRFVLGYGRGEVPDYLAAAFLMATYLQGMSVAETAAMTGAMIDSGKTIALSGVSRPKVDKHSTGGVSDGVTLVFAPLAASLGLAVAKLSGRGLGHTGGTLDKLESIPGLRTDLSPDELERQVEEVGCAVAGQSKDLVPADGAFYALRDATGTVASIPLIAASVMCKKLAVATDLIMLDVKAGAGAFMKTPALGRDLAEACVGLAAHRGRRARAWVTEMSQPLGRAIGNALDIAEAVRILAGEERGRVRDLSVAFAAEALVLLTGRDIAEAAADAERAMDSGAALEAFARMVESQGGDPRVTDDPASVLPGAPVVMDVPAGTAGWVRSVDAEDLGKAATALGAGRMKKGESIDPAAGIEFLVSVGDRMQATDPIARLHGRSREQVERLAGRVQRSVTWSDAPVEPLPLVLGRFGDASVGELPGWEGR
jgi:pyrimidine-nucleoside phosphorylase